MDNFDEYGKKAKDAVKSVVGYVKKKFTPEPLASDNSRSESTVDTLSKAEERRQEAIRKATYGE